MKTIKNILSLLFFIYLANTINSFKSRPLFKCEHDVEEEKGKVSSPNKIIERSDKEKEDYKRRMDTEIDSNGFKDFKIYIDLVNIKEDIKTYNLSKYEDLMISSMNKVVNTLQSLLKVKPLKNNYKIDTQFLLDYNIKKYDTSMFGNEANKGLNDLGIDLVIFGLVDPLLGESTLATAAARKKQDGDLQPYAGILKLNKDLDLSKPKSEEYFQAILVHEFTHILGFSKDFFQNKVIYEEKKDNYGIDRSYLNGAKLLAVAKKYYNCDSITGVELENQGGSGTAGSHWEARILLGEYMNGYAYTEEQVISEFTLAVLEDLGYYKANYYTGGLMRYGKHKGCDFLEKKCIENEKLSGAFKNEFFDSINHELIDPSCSSGRQSRTYNAFYPPNEVVPDEYFYFKEYNVTGYLPADYCPIPQSFYEEEENRYYVGHCSKKGDETKYGTMINVYDNNFRKYIGEVLSDHSFCFLSSLAKNDLSSKVVRANCYEVSCSDRSLTLHIFKDYIVCPRGGGKIRVDGYKGYLLCPDYNLICSGSIICNDMFDCVDKKSEVKDSSYIYDYEIKTNQNIKEAESTTEISEDYYEESTNGKCSVNCKQCRDGNCLKCRKDYALKYGNNNKVECDELENLKTGYFLDKSEIYTKCIDHCNICSDKKTCNECEDNYYYFQKECKIFEDGKKKIENCHEYDAKGSCVKCKPEFAFKDNNKEECSSINNLIGYYSEDGISYYHCSKKNENWTECYYNKTEYRVKGLKCKEEQIFVPKGKGVCYTLDEFENNTKLFKINETHGGICSKEIPNCLECESANDCTTCKMNYEFDIDKNECVVESNNIYGPDDSSSSNSEDKTDSTSTSSKRRTRKVKKSDLTNGNSPWIIANINIIITLYSLFLLIL